MTDLLPNCQLCWATRSTGGAETWEQVLARARLTACGELDFSHRGWCRLLHRVCTCRDALAEVDRLGGARPRGFVQREMEDDDT